MKFKTMSAVVGLLFMGTVAWAQIPAFPGAEGFGAYASGGRGGDVYTVTSLNNSGAGTLREALDTAPAGGRTIVFAVSGYIPVVSDTNFQVPANVTIAGQTAPGDGVGLKGGRMLIKGNNTIMRHFRIRHGKYGTGGDCLNIDYGIDETMIDHVSMMFSTDENFSFFGTAPDNFTMQYSTSTWGMERHNAGGLWDLDHGTCHHSLWAHHRTRNPKARPTMLEWINNVTFHWRNEGFIMGDSETPANWKANVRGCYYISIDDADDGSTVHSTGLTKAWVSSAGVPNFSLYLDDTLYDYNDNGVLDGTDRSYAIVDGSEFTPGDPQGANRYYKSATPFTGAPAAVSIDDPLTAYKKVVSSVGPLRLDASAVSLRDELDSLLIDTVTNQYSILVQKDGKTTGEDPARTNNGEQLLADQYGISNNGFGTLNTAPARADSDGDGMPDDWELALGSNVASQDHNTVFANNGSIITASTFFPSNTEAGYTYLEEYLHFCAIPHAWMAKNTVEQPTSLTVDLSRYTDGFMDAPVFTISNVVGGSVNQTGSVVEFTPTQDSSGRAGFDFNVTDADGSSWTQQFAILVTVSAEPRELVWVGGNNGNVWDTATVNWETSGASPTTFGMGDIVLFDNSGNNSTISVSSNLTAQSMTVSGTQNYSFSGPGALSVVDGFTNSSSGTLTLNTSISTGSGTLLDGGETVINSGGSLSGGEIELAGGATVTDGTGGSQLLLSPNLQVSSGETGTLDLSTWADVNGNLSGGGTLSIDVNSTGDYFAGDWSAFTGQINVTANSGSDEFKINRGYESGLQLASGRLHLGDGVVMHQVVNGPNDTVGTPHNIGELSGTSGAVIGAQPIGGRYAEWIIGALNTDSTFAGVIRDSDYADPWGGYGTSKLSKVGSGKLTLSGNNTYSGNTAIWDGELNVTGSLGGTDVYVGSGSKLSGSGAVGNLLTLLSGGEIDVGDTPGTVGTMMTSGGITLKAGILYFDLSSNPASGNDQILNSAGTLTFDGSEGAAHFVIHQTDGYLSEGTYNLILGGVGSSAPYSPSFTLNLTDTLYKSYSLQRSGGGSTDAFVRLVVTDLDPGTIDPADPVAWYRFEEGTAGTAVPYGGNQIVDSAGGDDNLNAYAANTAPDYSASVPVATIPQTGATNTVSTHFDGSDDLYTAVTSGPLVTTIYSNFTVEAYVNFDSLTGFQTIVGRDDDFGDAAGGVSGDARALLYLSKHVDGHFRIEACTAGSDYVSVEGSLSPVQNTWYHIAAVGDAAAGTLTLYVDGQNVGSSTGFDGLYPSTTHPWSVGRGMYNGAAVDQLSGMIDEVRITDAALSPVQFLNFSNPDTDYDGLDDAWEMAQFGNLDQSGTDDPDGDGDDNETEESNGTDPTVSSIPPVIGMAMNAGALNLNWSSNHTGWRLLYNTNLTGGTWAEVFGSDTTNIYTVPLGDLPPTTTFYKMIYP